jgi:hypothetical protein
MNIVISIGQCEVHIQVLKLEALRHKGTMYLMQEIWSLHADKPFKSHSVISW